MRSDPTPTGPGRGRGPRRRHPPGAGGGRRARSSSRWPSVRKVAGTTRHETRCGVIDGLAAVGVFGARRGLDLRRRGADVLSRGHHRLGNGDAPHGRASAAGAGARWSGRWRPGSVSGTPRPGAPTPTRTPTCWPGTSWTSSRWPGTPSCSTCPWPRCARRGASDSARSAGPTGTTGLRLPAGHRLPVVGPRRPAGRLTVRTDRTCPGRSSGPVTDPGRPGRGRAQPRPAIA